MGAKHSKNTEKQGDDVLPGTNRLPGAIMPYETVQALLGTIRHYSDIQATYKPLRETML